MAKLENIAESLNLKLSEDKKIKIDTNTGKAFGQKRRSWLTEDESAANNDKQSKGVDRPLKQTGSIDPVHKPGSSTPFINGVYAPLYQKGSIKGVYRPLNLSLEKLRGNPLKIAQYIFELSRDKKDRVTGNTTQSELMKNLEISKDSARTGMRFLLKNRLVERIDFKEGKAGWSKYRLDYNLFLDILQALEKGSIDPLTQKGSNSSSSYINTTTTDRPLLGWDDVDVSALDSIGLTKKHLLQLKDKNSPEVVQESINHFAFALLHNEKTKVYKDPLNVFMGVLRKGQGWVEGNYESTQERALQALIEGKKRQSERQGQLIKELTDLEYPKWVQSLSEEEKKKIVPEQVYKLGVQAPVAAALRSYFVEQVLTPRLKEEKLL